MKRNTVSLKYSWFHEDANQSIIKLPSSRAGNKTQMATSAEGKNLQGCNTASALIHQSHDYRQRAIYSDTAADCNYEEHRITQDFTAVINAAVEI